MQSITSSNKKQILLIFDKFKDTLSAGQICQIVREKIQEKLQPTQPNPLVVNEIPISDGGDGFVNCMFQILKSKQNVRLERTSILDPLLRETETQFLIDLDNKSAYIEVANSSGLQMLSKEERNPFLAKSIGTGQLIKHCYDTWQIKRYILGSGGSAFVDGGYGAMIGLGLYQLKDQNQLKTINYHNIVDVLENTIYNNDQYQKGLKDLEFILPCDVQNPMVGPNGAAFIFGPQKGAQQGDLEKLDQNMISTIEFYLRSRFGDNYSQEYLQTISDTPGTGAAGGLVACLLANFSDVKVISGMDYISQLINLEQQIQDSSVIFSGEGSFDSQTLEGKVVCKIHELCKKHSKPLVIVCGINKLNQQEQECIQRENENMSIFDLVTNFGIDRSMKDTANCLSELVEGKIIDHIKKYIV